MHSVGILLSQRVRLDGDHLPTHHPALNVIQIPPVCTQVGLRDFSQAAELIDRARAQTARFLAGAGDTSSRREGCSHALPATQSSRPPQTSVA
jgi:hypothetical protein